jgi:hypothetical protein
MLAEGILVTSQWLLPHTQRPSFCRNQVTLAYQIVVILNME